MLYVEAVGAGGGGYSGQSQNTQFQRWTFRTGATLYQSAINSNCFLAYGNNIWISTINPHQREIYASTDTIHWSLRTIKTRTTGNQGIQAIGLYYAGGLYISSFWEDSPDYRGFATSTDTIVWSYRTLGFANFDYISRNSFIYASVPTSVAPSGYIFLGGTDLTAGGIYVSTDAIHWTSRTAFQQQSIYGHRAAAQGSGAGSVIIMGSRFGDLIVSTDTINWTMRTTGNTKTFTAAGWVNGNYVLADNGNEFWISTNAIQWSKRPSNSVGFAVTATISEYYVVETMLYMNNELFAAGGPLYSTVYNNDPRYPALSKTTDGISWVTISGSMPFGNLRNNFKFKSIAYDPDSRIMLQASGGDISPGTPQLTAATLESGGSGGAGGAYASWYIPRPVINSNMTIIVGAGATGATTEYSEPSTGTNPTTIRWNAGIGFTCTLIVPGASATGIPGLGVSLPLYDAEYTTSGGTGAIGVIPGIGLTAPMQNALYQPTGGGAGAAGSAFFGGSSGAIAGFGSMYSASHGSLGIIVGGIPVGSGGGGGSATSTLKNGGNGVRGGGGGGGAGYGNNYGVGGSGGHGYVKISWW